MTDPAIAFYITSTGWGGLEMNTVKLAGSLREKGYSITLITQKNSTIYNKGKLAFDSSVLISNKKKYFDFAAAKEISAMLRKHGISVVLVFDNKDIDVLSLVKRFYLKSIRIVYQQHMQIGIRKKDILHTYRFYSIDCWISPLHYLKDEVLTKTRFPEEKIKVIPLCLDTSRFIPQKYSRQMALEKLGINPKALLLGIIGRISLKKGQGFLVESVVKLKKEGIDTELLIFGSATVNDPESMLYFEELLQKIKDQHLDDLIHFVDFNEDVALFYNAIDVFVLASEKETYGMVTIEAMLSGIPLIATRSGGTSEILENGKLGALYAYENYHEFREKLIWHLENREASLKMALLAQQTAKSRFSQEIETKEIDILIRSLGS